MKQVKEAVVRLSVAVAVLVTAINASAVYYMYEWSTSTTGSVDCAVLPNGDCATEGSICEWTTFTNECLAGLGNCDPNTWPGTHIRNDKYCSFTTTGCRCYYVGD